MIDSNNQATSNQELRLAELLRYSNEHVKKVQIFFRDHNKAHIREAALRLGLSFGSV